MTDQYSIAEARRNLPTLVRDAEAGKAVELTRRGAPVAILIGRRSYERLVAGPPGLAKSFATFARDVGLHELALDPDASGSAEAQFVPDRNHRTAIERYLDDVIPPNFPVIEGLRVHNWA